MLSQARVIELHYRITPAVETWVLPEGKVPESRFHDLALRRLVALFEAWAERAGRNVMVARDLALRWVAEAPRIGLDPDVCLIEPPPPEGDRVVSLCTWKPGHRVPRLAIEVVSKNHPHKGYAEIQERYAACGVEELWVLDPLLHGPKHLGGPVRLQVWRREVADVFTRVYAGNGPYHSAAIDVWARVDGDRIVLSDDRAGEAEWHTREELERSAAETARVEREHERAEKERERAEKERERAEKERERAEKEAERAKRLELERRLEALEQEAARRR
jgi:Uma2 family endonuclease